MIYFFVCSIREMETRMESNNTLLKPEPFENKKLAYQNLNSFGEGRALLRL